MEDYWQYSAATSHQYLTQAFPPNLFATVLDEAIKAGKKRPINSVKVAAQFLDSINCLMSHRILSTMTETIEEDIREQRKVELLKEIGE